MITTPPKPDGPTLKRTLGPVMLTLYGVGTTIGAGIYVLIGEVAASAGVWAPHAFLLASVVAGLTALSFAELAARYPKSAGEALYVRTAFGRPALGLVVGLAVVSAGIISAAAVVVGGAGYLRTLVDLPAWLLITVLVMSLGGIAAWGIRESVAAAAALTLIEIGGLALVIGAGVDHTPELATKALATLLPSGPLPVVGLFAGTILAFYAFIGFEDMVNVAEEVHRPGRTIPIAIVTTLIVASVLYLGAAILALVIVPLDDLAGAPAPLALVYERTGGDPRVLGVIGALATVNGVLVQMVMGARVLFGLANQDALPAVLGRVSPVTRTPVLATALVTSLILALALFLPIAELARLTSAITLAIFAACNLALMRLHARDRAAGEVWRGFRLPRFVPILGALVSLGMLALEVARRVGG
ncbi:MAG: amino acid permease [Alphaproteobacteria bacterium]|nr:amino acid permease [Alphaproteobacteria bacterium]